MTDNSHLATLFLCQLAQQVNGHSQPPGGIPDYQQQQQNNVGNERILGHLTNDGTIQETVTPAAAVAAAAAAVAAAAAAARGAAAAGGEAAVAGEEALAAAAGEEAAVGAGGEAAAAQAAVAGEAAATTAESNNSRRVSGRRRARKSNATSESGDGDDEAAQEEEEGEDEMEASGGAVARKSAKRMCRYPGCNRVIKSQGHCQRHGARAKRCKVEGCDKQAQGTHDGMCKRHWKAQNFPEKVLEKIEPEEPPEPEGESVYDSILPLSIAYRPAPPPGEAKKTKNSERQDADTNGIPSAASQAQHKNNQRQHPWDSPPPPGTSVMPLVAYLRAGSHRELGWHRHAERRARGLFPVSSVSSQLEPWERQLALVEILLLSGGTPYADFKDLAHAWGRDKGFHLVLANSVCVRRGEVERKKRSDFGIPMTTEQRETHLKKVRATLRAKKETGAAAAQREEQQEGASSEDGGGGGIQNGGAATGDRDGGEVEEGGGKQGPRRRDGATQGQTSSDVSDASDGRNSEGSVPNEENSHSDSVVRGAEHGAGNGVATAEDGTGNGVARSPRMDEIVSATINQLTSRQRQLGREKTSNTAVPPQGNAPEVRGAVEGAGAHVGKHRKKARK